MVSTARTAAGMGNYTNKFELLHQMCIRDRVDPAGGGKQAGKVFHAGAAVIIGTFLRVGNDQVRRNINHAACAEIRCV